MENCQLNTNLFDIIFNGILCFTLLIGFLIVCIGLIKDLLFGIKER